MLKRLLYTILLTAVCITCASCAKQQPSSTQTGLTPSDTHSSSVTLTPVTEMVFELDLSEDKNVSYDTLLSAIQDNPALSLIRADNTTLTSDQYIKLCRANDKVALKLVSKITFENFTIDLTKNETDISKTRISDKVAFDDLMSVIPEGHKIIMCDCNYTNEEMGALREKHPHVKFDWRVYMGERWSLRTDDVAFSVMILRWDYTRMKNEDIQVLKYCTELRALDIGHQAITDISVLSTLTKLEILIIADNKISDISPLANLTELVYLEFFMNKVSDVSPLAQCTKLIDLNFGWNYNISDISSLYSLENIERLWLPTTAIKESQQDEIRAAFPDAKIIFKDVDSTSSGWRTHPRFKPMRAIFKNNVYDENFTSYKE